MFSPNCCPNQLKITRETRENEGKLKFYAKVASMKNYFFILARHSALISSVWHEIIKFFDEIHDYKPNLYSHKNKKYFQLCFLKILLNNFPRI